MDRSAAPLLGLLIVGGAIAYVAISASRRRAPAGSAVVSPGTGAGVQYPSVGTAAVPTDPYQAQINALAQLTSSLAQTFGQVVGKGIPSAQAGVVQGAAAAPALSDAEVTQAMLRAYGNTSASGSVAGAAASFPGAFAGAGLVGNINAFREGMYNEAEAQRNSAVNRAYGTGGFDPNKIGDFAGSVWGGISAPTNPFGFVLAGIDQARSGIAALTGQR